jgi:hypothetical protein
MLLKNNNKKNTYESKNLIVTDVITPIKHILRKENIKLNSLRELKN